MNLITQDRLKSLTTYDPNTGLFKSLVRRKQHKPGGLLGCVNPASGYVQIKLDCQTYKAHRLAWLYVYGFWPTGQIDHINHDRADNRIANLRDVSNGINHHNRARKTKSSSGHLGVGWHKRDACWQAHLEVSGRRVHIGYFTDLAEAINARKAAEKLYHPSRPEHADNSI